MPRTLTSSAAAQRRLVSYGAPTRWGIVAPGMYALALAWWAASWNLRNSVLMAWSPVDPVWIGTGAVALCVAHRCGQPLRLPTSVTGPLALLVLGFLPGALSASGQGYGPVKVATLIFVVLPVVCASTVLLDSRMARRCWVYAQTLVGLAVVVAALEFNDVTRISEQGRFALATLDTITTARYVGVAFVVLLLLALTSLRHTWWALPIAAVCAAALVHVGSRGPSLAAILSVVIVVVAGRFFFRHHIVLLPATVAVVGVTYWYAQAEGGSGGARIVESLQSGLSDHARAALLRDALRLGSQHPFFGIGWGDFAENSKTAHEIANAQGVAYAHNSFAEAFCESGLLALVVFVVFVVLALYRLQRLSGDPHEAVLLGTTIYWLLNAQVSSDLVGNRFMWISLAVGIASYADLARQRSRDAPETGEKPI